MCFQIIVANSFITVSIILFILELLTINPINPSGLLKFLAKLNQQAFFYSNIIKFTIPGFLLCNFIMGYIAMSNEE
jgi:hypothetical protein